MPATLSKELVGCKLPVGALTFQRRLDGAVIVTIERQDDVVTEVIPANHWASIISTLTPSGETGVTFGIALALHTGGCAYDPDAK